MSARPDIRQLPLSPSNAPGGPSHGPSAPPGSNQHHLYRHPQINPRHAPGANYLPVNVDTGPANKGGIRCPPAGGGGGQPSVSLANLSVGRSSSPAAAMAAAMRQGGFPGSSASSSSSSGYSSTNHRPPGQQQPSANDQGPVRYVYPQPTQQQQQQYASMQQQQQQRDPGSVFVRNPADRGGIPVTVSELRPSPSHVPTTCSSSTIQQQQQQLQQQRNSIRQQHPQSMYPVENAYLREAAAAHSLHSSLHALHAAGSLPPHTAGNGPSVAQAVAAAAAAASAVSTAAELPNKRARIEVTQQGQGGSVATPLTIDTREAVRESMYHPQVEAISPTGPEACGERDDLKAIKEDLLKKITKVDREILKAESQIAKLKKKQQELEDAANKPLSDSNDEIERPKNQSVAQVIYAENRKKAKASHAALEKFALINNELPLYNQPSDTGIYHTNKRNHANFKKVLVEHFKRKNEERESGERYTTETYSRLSAAWMKKVEKIENSKKRKEKDARARELYEKIFPELRKQREDKERDHRLGTRGAVRSEADIEDVIERLQEQEMEDKKMHSYAVIPPLLLPPEARRRKFINTNGLIQDPLKEYNERKFINMWTDAERDIFKEKFLLHPKNFGQIAQFLERKTVSDCVQYYYLSKKTENYKQLLRKSKMRRRGRGQPAPTDQVISNVPGVVTRHRNKNEEKAELNNQDEVGGSNRSTPQPGTSNNIKQEIKEEKENEDGSDKKGKNNKEQRNDTSEEDEGPVKSGPHPCSVCKATVEQSRAVTQKSLALLLGLREDELGPETRACNTCYAKAQRKKHAHCPIPTCTATKGRVKGRLRHMPKKWSYLPKDVREAISGELQIPDGTKKCCSACFTKMTRKIAQLMGGGTGPDILVKSEGPDPLWTDDEVEILKTCLRLNGRNWTLMGEKLSNKTSDQCKKFFYESRKKYQLDKLVLEYKRAHQSGDQPPSLSTDEESGSSTSSCEEDITMQTNATASGSSSPARRNHVDNSRQANDVKPPAGIKLETVQVKTEVKTEVKSEESSPLPSTQIRVHPATGLPTKEEEYDSSATMSADERESDMNPPRSAYSMPSQGYPQARPDVAILRQFHPQGPTGAVNVGNMRPQMQQQPPQHQQQQHQQQFATPLDVRRSPFSGGPNQQMSNVTIAPSSSLTLMRPPNSTAQQPPSTSAPTITTNGPRETITVKELMINVIERSLSTGPGTSASASAPPPSPTIHNLLENSRGIPIKNPNYVRDRINLTPTQQQQQQQQQPKVDPMRPMAPPAAVPRPPQQQVNDCETLDLSMPRRRDVTPPPAVSIVSTPQYREPSAPPHHPRSSPSLSASAAADFGNRAPPPPAHSANKVKTHPDAYSRGVEQRRDPSPASASVGYPPQQNDGRRLTTPPQHMGANRSSAQSPGLVHSIRASPAPNSQLPHRPQLYAQMPMQQQQLQHRQQGPPANLSQQKSTAASPKLPQEIDRPLTIQTGSITQGTPVNVGASRSYEPLLKVTPPGSDKGSITQGTPVYDKKHHLLAMQQQEAANKNMAYDRAEFYRRSEASPASAAATQAYYAGQQARSVPYGNETHLSSRQVLMNDYAMARSTEMQRRPDSREHHPPSPGMMPSPRSRGIDPRSIDPRTASAQLEVVRQRSAADRYEPSRNMPEPRGDPKADLPNMQHRGDPRAGLQDPRNMDPRGGIDPRGDPRADLRIDLRRAAPTTLERGDPRMVLDPRMHIDARSAADQRIVDARMDPRYVAAAAVAAASRPGSYHQQIYLSSDGRYVAPSLQHRDSRSMSPPRNTPPPRSMAATTIVQPRSVAGNLTTGAKLGQREVEIYRTHPEVTISKTNSPRHGYNDQNPLASLVDVAVQQPKLPDLKERQMQLHHQQQQQARAVSQYDRAKYEVQENHRQERYASQGGPGGSSSFDPRGPPGTSSQIVQQVRAERSKQLYLLQGDRVVTTERGYPMTSSSAARITSAPSEMKSGQAPGHLPRPPSSGGRGDVPAVIINERSGMGGHTESRTVTAASLIDAIITHSINSGPPADGGVSMPPKQFQYRRSPGTDQGPGGQDGGKASPYNKMTNGPMEDGGQRSSNHELPKTTLTMSEHMDHLLSKDLTIQPATSAAGGSETSPDHYWKRRAYPEQLRAASAVTTAAPRNAASLVHGDERQITRVAQVISPRHSTSSGVEPISPPNNVQQMHGSPPGVGDPIARFLDAQKRHSQSSDGKGGHPPGMSPLDYVKNKIVEEMKKNEGSAEYMKNKIAEEMKAQAAAASGAGTKRLLSGEGHPSTSANNGDRGSDGMSGESPRKKMRLETHENDLPDSPGSGEMVIDETARPDSVSSQKTASPAPSSNANASSQQQPPTSYGSTLAPPASSSSSTSIAGNASKYEPLSDDE